MRGTLQAGELELLEEDEFAFVLEAEGEGVAGAIRDGFVNMPLSCWLALFEAARTTGLGLEADDGDMGRDGLVGEGDGLPIG